MVYMLYYRISGNIPGYNVHVEIIICVQTPHYRMGDASDTPTLYNYLRVGFPIRPEIIYSKL